MLDAVMLVLREVLEAALFVSLLLALGVRFGQRPRWAWIALPAGLIASWGLSEFAGRIAEAFDGVGQELTNGLLYALAIAGFILINAWVACAVLRPHSTDRKSPRNMLPLFVLVVACSVAREGSEIWIYLSSFAGDPSSMSAAVAGGLVGAGIGLSLCALVYYAFSFLGRRSFLILFFVLVTLVVGGLSMQLAKLGAQIGWVDSGPALWDTNWVVSERSWLGQLLHALFGYDANPDAAQAAFYFVSLGAVCLVAAIRVGLLRDSSRA